MNGDDALHDGKPQTGTLNLGAQSAVETLEDALTFFGGNPRAVVGDGDEGVSLFFRETDLDAAAFGSVADGVVREVGDHEPQGIGKPHGGYVRWRIGSERNGLGFRNRSQVFGDAFYNVGQSGFCHRFFGGIRIETRDGEKLFHKTCGAAHALLQAPGVFGAVFVGFGARQKLCLKFDTGQRRSQFVCGVACKALLCRQTVAQTLHQAVYGIRQALHLIGKPLRFQRG